MRLRFTHRALADIAGIGDYIRLHDPVAALRVRDAILDGAQILARFPRLGRPQSTTGVRKFVTRRYAYVIYYVVDERDGEVAILSVQHPAREPAPVDPRGR